MQQGQKAPIVAFKPSPEWLETASRCADKAGIKTAPRIMVCGPKGSGKSSFVKYLCNRLLSSRYEPHGVGYMDLDPGQPEFSSPGDISLYHLKSLNLGPPFTHPDLTKSINDRVLRSHHFGGFSPRDNISSYIEIFQNLFDHYCRTIGCDGCPLVVNCCGWAQGSGLETLVQIGEQVQPTNIVLLSPDVGGETEERLERLSARKGAKLHILRSGRHPSISSVAPSVLRGMQSYSYFHLDKVGSGLAQWHPELIYRQGSLCLPFDGPKQSFVGVLVLGAEVNYELLEDAIVGTVLSLAILEDPGSLVEDASAISLLGAARKCDVGDHAPTSVSNRCLNTFVETDGINTQELENCCKYRVCRSSCGLPYLSMGIGANRPLNPSKTYSLGQVFLRAIDAKSKQLEIATPIPQDVIQEYISSKAPLVLVRGNTGMPAWAYVEERLENWSVRRTLTQWGKKKGENPSNRERYSQSESEDAPNVTDSTGKIPWIECKMDSTRRHGRERVWKVRRNLTSQRKGPNGREG